MVGTDTSQRCYVSLVENLHVSDVDCLKLAISKGLGIAIVLGGAVMKVPQLLLSPSGSQLHQLKY
jgi:mannose-P-dolichol utilization defect 1